MNRLSLNLIRKYNNIRLFNSYCAVVRGGHNQQSSHGDKEHGHDHGHGNGHGHGPSEYFEHASKGYVYREIRNMGTKFEDKLSTLLMSALWFWIFYSFMVRSEDFFGHHEYPDPSKWTDAELGIKDE